MTDRRTMTDDAAREHGTAFMRPVALEDACRALSEDKHARSVAGCTLLTPRALNSMGEIRLAIDLTAVAGLDEIVADGGDLRIGATATAAALARDEAVRAGAPLLATVAGEIGDAVIREVATVGGSVAASIASGTDLAIALLALGVELRLASAAGERATGIEALELDRSEIVAELIVPSPAQIESWAWHRQPTNMRFYTAASAAITQSSDRGPVISVGAPPLPPRRLREAEQALADGAKRADVLGAAASELGSIEVADDGVATPAYRRRAAELAVGRCLEDLREG